MRKVLAIGKTTDAHQILSIPSPVAQMVKSLPAVWETWLQFLGQEDPLEKEMANYSSILAWKIPWTEEPDGVQPMGAKSRAWLSD